MRNVTTAYLSRVSVLTFVICRYMEEMAQNENITTIYIGLIIFIILQCDVVFPSMLLSRYIYLNRRTNYKSR
jgi:hypothetical protein